MIVVQIFICIFIPVFMIITGYTIKKNQPAFGSGRISYRTRASRRSVETWRFANMFFSVISVIAGINLFLMSIIFFLVAVLAADVNGWFLAGFIFMLQMVCMLIIISFTEVLLKKKFDKNGVLVSIEKSDKSCKLRGKQKR